MKLSRTACKVRTQPCSDPTTGLRQRQPAVGLQLRSPSLMDYYSFNRPQRDGWLSWPCWLTDSGRFTHKVVTQPAVSLMQVRESSPARTGGLTTMLCHHQSSLLRTDQHGSYLWRRLHVSVMLLRERENVDEQKLCVVSLFI